MRISLTGVRTLRPHAKYLSTLQRLWPVVATMTSGQSEWNSKLGDSTYGLYTILKVIGQDTSPPRDTDIGNAERLVARHKLDVRFSYTSNEWLVWDGKRFAVDHGGEIERRAKDIRNARAAGKQLGRPRRIVDRGEILRLRAEGASVREIAAKVGVGYGTVRKRLAQVS
jgi:hypothetical protein